MVIIAVIMEEAEGIVMVKITIVTVKSMIAIMRVTTIMMEKPALVEEVKGTVVVKAIIVIVKIMKTIMLVITEPMMMTTTILAKKVEGAAMVKIPIAAVKAILAITQETATKGTMMMLPTKLSI